MQKAGILAYKGGIGQRLDIYQEAKVTYIDYNTVAPSYTYIGIHSDKIVIYNMKKHNFTCTSFLTFLNGPFLIFIKLQYLSILVEYNNNI